MEKSAEKSSPSRALSRGRFFPPISPHRPLPCPSPRLRAVKTSPGRALTKRSWRSWLNPSKLSVLHQLLDGNIQIQQPQGIGHSAPGSSNPFRRLLLGHSVGFRVKAVSEITKGGLNVRQTEKLVKTLMSHGLETPAPEKKASAEVDYAAEAAKSLSTRLGRACHQRRRPAAAKIKCFT